MVVWKERRRTTRTMVQGLRFGLIGFRIEGLGSGLRVGPPPAVDKDASLDAANYFSTTTRTTTMLTLEILTPLCPGLED